MNIVLSVIGCLAIFAGCIIPVILKIREENNRSRRSYGSYGTSDNDEPAVTMKKKPFLNIWTLLIVIGIAAMILGNSFEIIPTGYTGVRTTFGQVDSHTVPNGFCWKIPFAQDIKTVNNKQQDIRFGTEVWGETTNKTPVFAADIIVKYQIDSGKSAWIFSNVADTSSLISYEIVASATKAAMVELDVNEVTNRAKIEPLVREKLEASIEEAYGENTIHILKVTINNMDFEAEYNAAIQAKSLAEQARERQRIENQTAMEQAEAARQIAITKAEADAEAKRIAAEAEAEAIRIAADAQAEANTKLRESLSDEVLQSMFYEKWDGKLPTVMGSDTVITDITNNDPISFNP